MNECCDTDQLIVNADVRRGITSKPLLVYILGINSKNSEACWYTNL